VTSPRLIAGPKNATTKKTEKMTSSESANDWKAKQRAESALTMERIRLDRQSHRFLLNSHNSVKLRKSLSTVGMLRLADVTLLTPQIHKKHADALADKLIKQWRKVRDISRERWAAIPLKLRRGMTLSDSDIAASQIRFFTLVDSVTVVDAASALLAANKLKANIEECVANTRGLWCLGGIEAEVISLKKMREIKQKDTTTKSEARKLDVCEILAQELEQSVYKADESFMLIHFHGVLSAKNVDQFSAFEAELKSRKEWCLGKRQIEIKKLSEHFAGKPKTTEQNLAHIAKYITKGGNDWYAGKAYLRYKIHFEVDDANVTDEETWVAKNWRRDQLLQQEHKLDGIEDAMSMTVNEIAELTIFIDGFMATNRTRTGYLVAAGR